MSICRLPAGGLKVLLCALTLAPAVQAASTVRLPHTPPRADIRAEARIRLSRTPLYFEPNVGQAAGSVRFLARGGGFLTLLSGEEAVFLNAKLSEPLKLRFAGAQPAPAAEPLEPLPGVSNYFYGKNPARWRTRVPHYGRVLFRQVYPGIDVVFYGGDRRLEYDFLVAPGADPSRIEICWSGAQRIRLDGNGDLLLDTSAGEVRQRRPLVYQTIAGKRIAVAARYRLAARGRARLELGAWNRNFPLIIDPVIVYSTYLGGAGQEEAMAIAVDPGGPVYIAGYTNSANFPLQGPIQNTIQGFSDVFVAKLNAVGTGLVYATFIGGEGEDRAIGIAADAQGNAYVTGLTGSFGFPVTPPTYQADFSGVQDAFLMKLAPFGDRLLVSTYLGPIDSYEIGYVVAVDLAGAITVAGVTNTGAFPTTPGAFDASFNGSNDIFVTKFDPSGRRLEFSTFIGGSFDERPLAIIADRGGSLYIAGESASPDFPTTPGAYDATHNGLTDAFVLKLAANGKRLHFSTLLGSPGFDAAFGLTIEPGGRIYIAGQAGHAQFPTTAEAYQRTLGGPADAFVAKLSSDASELISSTLIGTPSFESGFGVQAAQGGHAVLVGYTESNNFPVTPDAFQLSANVSGDAFLTLFTPLLNTRVFSTVLGGLAAEIPRGLAMDAAGDVYIAGITFSSNFPTTGDAFDRTHNGGADAFITRVGGFAVSECVAAAPASLQSFPQGGGNGTIGVGSGCPWNASKSVPWVSFLNSPLGVGEGTMNFTVGANSSAEPRTGAVYIAGNWIHLIQKGSNLTPPFNDVPLTDPFVDHIRIIKANNVTSGCTAVNYCPGDVTTRAQMAVFIIRSLLGTDEFSFPASPYFRDVASNHPQFKWIQKMRQLGITSGCNLVDYCPDQPVTRGQMAVFLVRAKFGDNFSHPSTPYFTDVPANHMFFRYVQKLRQFGVTSGCSPTQYCVDAPNTRGQMAVFLTRIFFTPI